MYDPAVDASSNEPVAAWEEIDDTSLHVDWNAIAPPARVVSPTQYEAAPVAYGHDFQHQYPANAPGATPAAHRRQPAGEPWWGDAPPPPMNVPEPTWDQRFDLGVLNPPTESASAADGYVARTVDAIFAEEPAPVMSSGSWLLNGHWFTEMEVAYMMKAPPRRIKLGQDVQTEVFFDTRADNHEFTAGARMTLGRLLGRDEYNRDHIVEFIYFGLFDWEASSEFGSLNPGFLDTVLGAGGFPQAAPAGFADANTQSFIYNSSLNSYELNARLRTRSGNDQLVMTPDGCWERHATTTRLFSYGAGLRIISINEQFEYFSEGAATSGFYRVRTYNDMFGPQFMGELTEQYSNWSWTVKLKLGAMMNFTDRTSRVETIGGIADRAQSVDGSVLAFMGDGSFVGRYFFRPNLSARASYDVLFVSSIADAPSNLSLTPAFKPLSNGGVGLYHGMSLGLEWVW